MDRSLPRRACRGFTLLELLLVLLVAGLLAAVLAGSDRFFDATLGARAAEFRNQIRYAQLRAMKTGTVHGLSCDAVDYWLFQTAPTPTTNRLPLPGEKALFVHLADTGLGITAFTLFFDGLGKPYTAYTDAATNSPVNAGNPVSITLSRSGATQVLTVTEETGFVP